MSEVCNFADDNSIYTDGKTIEEVTFKLEHDMVNAIQWFECNSLGANPDKFQLMILGTKDFSKKCLNINGMKCISTKSVKLLGIHVDWKLDFNNHVNIMCSNANKKRALYRLRSKLKLVLKTSSLIL